MGRPEWELAALLRVHPPLTHHTQVIKLLERHGPIASCTQGSLCLVSGKIHGGDIVQLSCKTCSMLLHTIMSCVCECAELRLQYACPVSPAHMTLHRVSAIAISSWPPWHWILSACCQFHDCCGQQRIVQCMQSEGMMKPVKLVPILSCRSQGSTTSRAARSSPSRFSPFFSSIQTLLTLLVKRRRLENLYEQ